MNVLGEAKPSWSGQSRIVWPVLARLLPSRTAMLVSVLSVSSIAFTYFAGSFFDKRASNAKIKALIAGQDVAVDPAFEPAEVTIGRLRYLLFRDRLEEAQSLIDTAAPHMSPDVRADALYNMANARLRLAFSEIEKRQLDQAIPLVRLAKDDYRTALKAKPENWDFKFNLDVAMRLVRDFPQPDIGEEEAEPESKRVWTDLPGVPKGLP
jgi:mxaK protein